MNSAMQKKADDAVENFKALVGLALASDEWYPCDRDDYTDPDDAMEAYYIGSILNIYPSGKFYMPWTSNQTDEDVEMDEAFNEEVEAILESFHMWLEIGDSDGLDLFLYRYINQEAHDDK